MSSGARKRNVPRRVREQELDDCGDRLRLDRRDASASGMALRLLAVSMVLGRTAFTRTPAFALHQAPTT
jgi:hypothetical protein